MPETESQQIYRQDARSLGELGRLLVGLELPRVEVRLPRALAERAVAAWEREEGEGPLDAETFEQRAQRHRAAAFSLIGLSVCERGRWERDEVVVDLNAHFIADAVNASDDLPPVQSAEKLVRD